MPREPRRWHQIPYSWSYRPTVNFLVVSAGTKLRSSARAIQTPNHWATSVAPSNSSVLYTAFESGLHHVSEVLVWAPAPQTQKGAWREGELDRAPLTTLHASSHQVSHDHLVRNIIMTGGGLRHLTSGRNKATVQPGSQPGTPLTLNWSGIPRAHLLLEVSQLNNKTISRSPMHTVVSPP